MKKEYNELDNLFRNGLEEYEMPVARDLWGELEREIPQVVRQRRMWFTRVASTASVLLVLTASSAAFWFLSSKQEIVDAFSQVEVTHSVTGTPKGDAVNIELPPLPPPVAAVVAAPQKPTPASDIFPTEEDTVSISFSMSITFSTSTSSHEGVSDYYRDGEASYYTQSSGYQDSDRNTTEKDTSASTVSSQKHPWSLQTALGTALPASHGKHKMPLVVDITAGKHLTDRLAVEAGVRYSLLHSEETLHYIGIPVKMNYTFLQNKKMELYATVGGVVDKCIAGAPDNGFQAEPIQLAVTGGIGARYQLNDKLAFFVEPGISHHFRTDSQTQTIRNERPTNFNLLCGVRMTY